MLSVLIFLAVCFLAYSNGANDNFKGVATLFGSRTCSYPTAFSWATVATFAGSVTALFLAQALLKKFSGKGLVPDALVASPQFVLAVALGAGTTVILATLLGFPISTTHGLTGALVGAGLAASAGAVNFAVLGQAFVMPLIVSPLLAVATGGLVYLTFRFARLRFGVTKEMCVCAGIEHLALPLPEHWGAHASRVQPTTPSSLARTWAGDQDFESHPHEEFDARARRTAAEAAGLAIASVPTISVAVDNSSACAQRYTGTVLGMNAGRLLDTLHFLSAGAVSFARGLNDTPKIAALLLVASALDIRWGLVAAAVAIALGGLLNARPVAETMSHKITGMNPGQGFAANLTTAALVTTASFHGLPVSTTHVSFGALLGMGIVTGQAKWKPVLGVLASWVVTVPSAALLSGVAYRVVQKF